MTQAREDVTITQASSTHYIAFGGWFGANTTPTTAGTWAGRPTAFDFQGNVRATR